MTRSPMPLAINTHIAHRRLPHHRPETPVHVLRMPVRARDTPLF